MRLHPTLHSDHAESYLEVGGPWDIACLDTLMADPEPNGEALLIDGDIRLGGVEVEHRVASLAGGLRQAGVEHGDVVAWQLPNGCDAVLLSRACWRLGAIAAPLHHRCGAHELDEMLALLEPRVTISRKGLPLGETPGVIGVDGDRYAALGSAPPVTDVASNGADLAVVLFTSGSTGAPKAVLHSHRSLGAKTLQMIAAHGLDNSDATLVQSPISHISGMLNGVLVPGVAGMRHVLMDRWDPRRGLQLIADEAVSFMVGPPAVFLSLMDAPGFSREVVDSLRVVSCGATGITPEFVSTAAAAFGALVKRSYGCTEAPTVTTSSVGDPIDRAACTDGRPLGATEVCIVDPGSVTVLDAGATGEVWVRGPELFAGYAQVAQSDAAMTDGWFRTGDLGRFDDEGWLTLVGRRKDVIIRGGENIVPAEVERALERHPAVRQAVVVGVADDRLGERIAAFIIGDTALDPHDCERWFVELGVAKFKSPAVVIRVEELPLLSLGKPDRAALRARAASIREGGE